MKKIWNKIASSKSYRDSFVSAHISNTVAAQLSLMREARGWTQKQLAEKSHMRQSRISALEDPNYENIEVATLKRLASAYDVGLTIKFVPFSELVSWSEHHDFEDLNVKPIQLDSLGGASLDIVVEPETTVITRMSVPTVQQDELINDDQVVLNEKWQKQLYYNPRISADQSLTRKSIVPFTAN